MAIYGCSPSNGYIATRDRLRNLRTIGSATGPEDPEHWFMAKTGQPMPSWMKADNQQIPTSDQQSSNLPDWLQFM